MIAAQLQQLNTERRTIEQGMQEEALRALASLDLHHHESSDLPAAITLFEPGWHQGVVGILASRIKERLHRPVIAFAEAEAGSSELKGSARSIPGIHIRDVLDAVATRHPGLLSRFGGHAMAAGLSLSRERYPDFAEAFVAEVGRHARDLDLQAVIESDGELAGGELDLELAQLLRYAGPWGQHFPEPCFDGRFRMLQQRLVGARHLKMVLQPEGGGPEVDAIAFGVDTDRWPDPGIDWVEVVYRPDVNEFRGRQSLQLIVEQLAPARDG